MQVHFLTMVKITPLFGQDILTVMCFSFIHEAKGEPTSLKGLSFSNRFEIPFLGNRKISLCKGFIVKLVN